MPWDSFRCKPRSSRSKDEASSAAGCFSKATLESRQRNLPKEIYQKIKEVDQQASTLTSSASQGLSARILDRYDYVQQLPDGREKVSTCQTLELIKKPAQTLGIYLREGNGIDRADGVFVSRLMEGCDVEKAGYLAAGDEIISVNDVNVTRMSIDDVVVMISIPRRLILRTRSDKRNPCCPTGESLPTKAVDKPVAILKQIPRDDSKESVMTDEGKPLASSQPLTTAQTSLGTRARMQNLEIDDSQKANLGMRQPPPVMRQSFSGKVCLVPESSCTKVNPPVQDQGPSRSLSDRWSYGRQLAMHSPRLLDSEGRLMRTENLQLSNPKTQNAKPVNAAGDGSLYKTAYIMPPKLQNTALSSNDPNLVKRERYSLGAFDSASTSYSHCFVPSNLPDAANTATNRMLYSPRNVASDTESYCNDPASRFTSAGVMSNRPTYSKNYKSPICQESTSDVFKSNSLPRRQNRRTIRWSNDVATKAGERLPVQGNYDVSDSDGVVSAPEIPLSPVRYPVHWEQPGQRHSAKTIDEVFSRAEYQSWLQCFDKKLSSSPLKSGDSFQTKPAYCGIDSELRKGSKNRSSSVPPRGLLAAGSYVRGVHPPNYETSPQSRRFPVDISPLPQRRYPLQLASSNVGTMLFNASPTASDCPSPFTGLLVIQIFEGRSLRVSNDMEELYCVIEVDCEHRARTEVKNQAMKFQWRESFEIDVWESKIIDLYIYSWHPQFRHKLRHRGSLQLLDSFLLSSLMDSKAQSFALNLEPRGQLFIRLGFLSMLLMYRRQLALRPSAYWGIPLSILVEREATDYEVPILLVNLLQEIERRGLNSMGLYVLSGSVEKKMAIINEIENNPLNVDLSPEFVPDINVLTSIFKDWLCALPEALVASSTYQTLIDAWRVCLPNDKEGNFRLIFGVLDCLPNVNKLFSFLTVTENKLSVYISVGTSTKAKSHTVNLLDHRLAARIMGTVLDLWPSKMNNSDSNESENSVINLSTKGPVSLMNICWKGNQIPESNSDQARKIARKRELKKNKKQRWMVRQSVLRSKDPQEIIKSLEALDAVELNYENPTTLNERVLQDKRTKLLAAKIAAEMDPSEIPLPESEPLFNEGFRGYDFQNIPTSSVTKMNVRLRGPGIPPQPPPHYDAYRNLTLTIPLIDEELQLPPFIVDESDEDETPAVDESAVTKEAGDKVGDAAYEEFLKELKQLL
ncbi:putative Rho GTPase-activating protein syd-1 [Trichinella spiralis]|uniref:putative Rho GTPase-activating protein syd-1 n=1 Tax=Trichinella spiralis TaxID=6334 RepID=UPI0001EFD371|nr:putative Rho GTPase-activating protein syd-1 [Trichinella spiralis]